MDHVVRAPLRPAPRNVFGTEASSVGGSIDTVPSSAHPITFTARTAVSDAAGPSSSITAQRSDAPIAAPMASATSLRTYIPPDYGDGTAAELTGGPNG